MAEQESSTTAPVELTKEDTTNDAVVSEESNTSNNDTPVTKPEDINPETNETKPTNDNGTDNTSNIVVSVAVNADSEIEAKEEMATALTTLISTFRDETIQQEELLSAMEQDALAANFGDISRAAQWTKKEVSHWLTIIGLQEYIDSFLSASIDGAILLNDLNTNFLKNDLKVKALHCNKILREIAKLKVFGYTVYMRCGIWVYFLSFCEL